MPGIADLPGWLWRRMGRTARLAALGALVLLVAGAAALMPVILESKEDQAETDRRERAERRAVLVERLETEQRPRHRRSTSVARAGATQGAQLEARADLVDELHAEILATPGPASAAATSTGPSATWSASRSRAASTRSARTSSSAARPADTPAWRPRPSSGTGEVGATGVIGHQYRTMVDFETSRYAFCKVSGQAGPSREQLVTTPRVCGG